ncbi:MAG: polymerase subunit beta protein [Candidatus Peregrinibacteria bacterium GW2011_GWA2_33_10]|nr:MAG: polymerase subunit beta protein [Candidatus Peregrinibacteria bacterium GW2011_GWA2_33_10]KKP38575.1 MAG: hypothetical protein UR30_C0017G0006 [Candidatus Peregrinibacteria bacterium GW2011_GWC2_33_13]OGJ49442.1 MAG: hypothetical protein A2229_00680 [Candidatus Peregrinibacteria bacterium RIFOXYA2_FULL_33_7]
MLKHLFTSKARVKLLSLFLLQPDEEYYIRELTRKLDEQINSVRRELDNLKKMGLLKSKFKNRRKFYVVNKNFVLFYDLRNIIVKAVNSKDNISEKIKKLGNIDFLLMAGLFLDKDDAVDLLIVGEVNKSDLEKFLNEQLETKRPVKFSILSTKDFMYRLKCNDRFVNLLVKDKRNIVAINKLGEI